MKSGITEIEFLLDKINLLFNDIKSDGQLDKIEAELFLKYIHQLKLKVEDIQPASKQQQEIVPPVVKQQIEQPVKKPEVQPPVEIKKPEPEVNIKAFENVKVNEEIKPEIKKEVKEVKDVFPVDTPEKKVVKKNFIKSDDDEDDEVPMTGLHNKLSKDKKTLADKINHKKGKDLSAGIDLNERIYFTRHLFKGDSNAFDQAIKQLNQMRNAAEASDYIQKELLGKLSWDDEEAIERFRELTERKFES